MYKVFALFGILLLGIASMPAQAQQLPPAVQGPARAAGDVFGLSSQQVVSIAVGAVVGVVVLDVLVGAPNILGAFAGGLVGNWYYNQELAGKSVATRTASASPGANGVELAGNTVINGVQLANATLADGAEQAQSLFARLTGLGQK